ncbi:MAG: hypothetical protein KJ718_04325 [Nanoarchaeota archaeon]|nr:hypothetical protein [Nanoarchaeota archaeon]MBU1051755.1 hypothetical protein [Nanoarchaeota archaeon]MBU1988364.1 hypothetical protein [Nanoarchaeota archaeon]
MNHRDEFLGLVITVSAIVALAGVGYIWVFSGGLGNIYYISPFSGADSGIQGIQLSPPVCDSQGVEKGDCPYTSDILCEIIWPKCFG